MVGIAQLAERLVVVQEVAGSSPVAHPGGARTDRSGPLLLAFPLFDSPGPAAPRTGPRGAPPRALVGYWEALSAI